MPVENNPEVAARLREIIAAVKKELQPPPGELECIVSGFVTFNDYRFIAQALKKISDLVLVQDQLTSPTASFSQSQSVEQSWRKMFRRVTQFSILRSRGTHLGSPPEEDFGSGLVGKFTKNYQALSVSPSQKVSRYKDDNALLEEEDLGKMGETPLPQGVPPQKLIQDSLQITLDEVAEITQHDEVLEMFFELISGLLPDYIQKQVKVLPYESVLEFLIYKGTTSTTADYELEQFERSLLSSEAQRDFANCKGEDVFNQAEIERVTKGYNRLVHYTHKVSFKYMERLAQSLPLGINARLSNDYLSPVVPISAEFVSCGQYASRTKEFFVPLSERVKKLSDTYSFSSSEEILICIAQLSNFLSNILSSFTLSALFITVDRIKQVKLYRKLRLIHHTPDSVPFIKDSMGCELSAKGFANFARAVCNMYNNNTRTYLDNLRRRFPNVFLLNSLIGRDDDGNTAQEETPSVLCTLVSILAKLIFLFAGGIGSIAADDRRGMFEVVVNSVLRQQGLPNIEASEIITDDIALANALHIGAVHRLTLLERLFTCTVSGEECNNKDGAEACADVWRVYFQYCGILPFGSACPEHIQGWIRVLPMYLFEDEGKMAILRVHSILSNQKPVILKPVMRENVLQSASVLVRKLSPITSPPSPEAKSVHKDAVHLTAEGSLVQPVFATKSRGIETFQKGQGPRRDFFELCASESTDTFLPTIDITNSVSVKVHSGKITELEKICVEPDKLQNVTSPQSIILLLRWKKRPSYYTAIRAGDVLAMEIIDNQLGTPITTNPSRQRGSQFLVNAGDFNFPTHAQSSPNDVDLSTSNTDELFRLEKRGSADVEWNDASNRGSRRSSIRVMNPLEEGEELITTSTVSTGVNINGENMLQLQVNSVLKTTSDECQVISISLPPGLLNELTDTSIAKLYHCRKALPPFWIEKGRRYAWTNPLFKCSSGQDDKGSSAPSSYRDIPFMLGWLIGNAPGNGVVFQAPIAPLAFRVLSRNIMYDQPVSSMSVNVFELNLICEKWTAEALYMALSNPQAVVAATGFGPETVVTGATIHTIVQRVVKELVLNIEDSEEQSRHFWEEFCRGVRSTPLGDTPVFAHSCSRTLRSLLCGRMDNARRSFSFKEHFLIAFDDGVGHMPYRYKLCKWTLQCLENVFNTEEKRLVLRFITGRALLPHKMKSEVIRICFNSLEVRDVDDVGKGMLRLPTSHTCDNTLILPNYLELLLVSPKTQYAKQYLMDGGRRKKLRVLVPSDYSAAWETLTEEDIEELRKEYTSLLATRLLTSIYETNGFTDDISGLERDRKSIFDTAEHSSSDLEGLPPYLLGFARPTSNNASFHAVQKVSVLALLARSEDTILLNSTLVSEACSPRGASRGASQYDANSGTRDEMSRVEHSNAVSLREDRLSMSSGRISIDKEEGFGFFRKIRQAEIQSTDEYTKKIQDRQQYINKLDDREAEAEYEREKAVVKSPKEDTLPAVEEDTPSTVPPTLPDEAPPRERTPPPSYFHNSPAYEFDLEGSEMLPSVKSPVRPPYPPPKKRFVKMPEEIRHLEARVREKGALGGSGKKKEEDPKKRKSVDRQIEELFPGL